MRVPELCEHSFHLPVENVLDNLNHISLKLTAEDLDVNGYRHTASTKSGLAIMNSVTVMFRHAVHNLFSNT